MRLGGFLGSTVAVFVKVVVYLGPGLRPSVKVKNFLTTVSSKKKRKKKREKNQYIFYFCGEVDVYL